MRYYTVERMAKYYYALQLIAFHDFSYRSACKAVGIKAYGDLHRMYKTVFLEMEDRYPSLINILKKTMERHFDKPNEKHPPVEIRFHPSVMSKDHWTALEDEVSQWPYYEEIPYAIEKWRKGRSD